jgi:signal transduction histidine kinase
MIGHKPIQLETDYAGVRGWVFTDPDRLKQVLIHVLDNAVKFTDEGKIVLGGRAENGFLNICVEDTGIGIDVEHQKFIFDGFHQVDNDDARRYEGVGIGLYLARRFLELLGGEIRVESAPGSGSRFKIRLPCNATA